MVISGTRLIDTPARVVKVGEEVKGQPSQITTGSTKFRPFNFQVLNEYYLEINELSKDCLSKVCLPGE